MADNAGTNILIIAGEASGDLHGANLVRQIKLNFPGIQFWGIGGEKLNDCGVSLLFHANQLAFLGFVEVIQHLPFILQVRKKILAEVKRRKPTLAILIDYPGFNLRLAGKLKKLSTRVFYYIAPQVWAWGRGRLKKMARSIDLLAVILPFEKELFHQAGIKVEFVGHPLLDVVNVNISREQFFDQIELNPEKKTLVLLPGSRFQEVSALLPDMLETARLLRENYPDLQVLVSRASTIERRHFNHISTNYKFVTIIEENTYAAIHYADAAIVASGTATLETACLGTPMVVVYRTQLLTYYLGKLFISIKNIGLVNIVAGRPIVPEYIQNQFVPSKVVQHLMEFIFNEKQRERLQHELAEVKNLLGKTGASRNAALLVQHLLEM